MTGSSRWRHALSVAAALAAEGVLLGALWAASGVLGSIDFSHLGAWVRQTAPTDALTAVVRLVGMAFAVWLLASTLLYMGASLVGADGLVRRTRWVTLPVLRRMVDALTAASILASSVAHSNGSASRPLLATAVARPSGPQRAAGGSAPVPAPSPRPRAGSAQVSERVVGRHLPHPGVLDHVLPAAYSAGLLLPTASDPFAGLAPGTKVVVVRPGDCLSVIAQEHLGDWRLDVQIHDLNVGRVQPDGRALTDDHWIYPGWVLVMPPDAVGTQVVPGPSVQPATPSEDGRQAAGIPTGASAENEPPAPGGQTRQQVVPPGPASSNGATHPAPTEGSTTPGPSLAPTSDRTQTPAQPATEEVRHPDLVGPTAGVAALVAAALIWRLGRRRREQMHDRRSGDRPCPNPPPVVTAETRARMIADTEAMCWVDAGLRYLGGQLADRHASTASVEASDEDAGDSPPSGLPSVVLARAGARGLEVMIAPACDDAPPRWTAIDEGAVWMLDPDIELEELEASAAGRWPFLPALVTVGTTVDGTVLANLEHAGSLAVEGEPGRVNAVMGQMLIELASQPWADEMLGSLWVTGDCGAAAQMAGVKYNDDAWALAETLDRVAEQTSARLGEHESAAVRRAIDGEFLPHVVVAYPGTKREAVQCLFEAAAPDRSSTAVVVVGADGPARWQLTVEGDGRATLNGMAGDRPFHLPLQVEAQPEPVELLCQTLSSSPAGTALTASPDEREVAPSLFSSQPGSGDEAVIEPATLESVEPGPVELRLLGTVKVAGAVGHVESARRDAPLAVLAYLAAHDRPVSLHDLAAALWPPNPAKEHFGMPAPKTVSNIISRARTLVGIDSDGKQRLILGKEGYLLASSVTTDWARFRALVTKARTASTSESVNLFRRALELVEGPPFRGFLDSPFFEWVSSEQLEHTIAAAVVDAAEDLAVLYLETGDTDGVLWAVEQGLQMDPAREQLYQCWMHALGRQAEVAAVRDVWRRLCNALQQHIDPGQAPSLESQDVYRSYVSSSEATVR